MRNRQNIMGKKANQKQTANTVKFNYKIKHVGPLCTVADPGPNSGWGSYNQFFGRWIRLCALE